MSDGLIQHALEIFESQAQRRLPPSLALLGPPGSGKSIFLNHLMNAVNRGVASFENTRSLMLDLRSIPIGSQLEIYFHINQALLQEAARIGINKNFDIKVQKSTLRFEEILRQLLAAVDGPLIIFIDHLESVPRLFASDLSHRFRSFLETTEHDSEYLRLGLIIAGAVSLYDLKHGPNSAFQMLPVIRFPQLQQAMQLRLVEDYLKNYMSTEISPDLISLFADLTGGEPGFLEPLIVHLLKDGKQISLSEELVLASVAEICSYSQIQVLRNLGLHLWGDSGLREIVRDLAQLPTVMPRSAVPDIDRYELSGAVVVGRGLFDKTREYKFRNGISKHFLTELYNVLEINGYVPKAQSSIEVELAKLETARKRCLNAGQIWSWMNTLREAWVAITPYNQPKLFLYVAKLGSDSGWWLDADTGRVSDAELREPSTSSTKVATFTALNQLSLAFGGDTESVKAFIESDTDQISIAIPLYAREIAIIIVATLSRTDAGRGLTEFDLCHWIRFVQNVKPVATTLTLAELGHKMIQEANPDNGTPQTPALSFATAHPTANRLKHILLIPGGGGVVTEAEGTTFIQGTIEKSVDDLNKRCLELVDKWTTPNTFETEIGGIAQQLELAVGAGFRSLSGFLKRDQYSTPTVIATTPEGLKIPFELFPDESTYLALQTGLSRQIVGSRYRLSSETSFNFDQLLSSLSAAREELRVLLIASDADGRLPRAGEELEHVRDHIEVGCRLIGVKPRFVVVPAREATSKRVEAELMGNRPHHILHYTGHARHVSEDPDASGVVLLGDDDLPDIVTCKRLSRWFKSSGLWLVYLSSCNSSAASGSKLGLSQRYVGTIEAVVEAGVPNVIGFRCLVSDQGALHLADEFYRQLFEVQAEKNLSLALLEARRKVYSLPRFFDAWASCILITQFHDTCWTSPHNR
jgi:hypothetical protein